MFSGAALGLAFGFVKLFEKIDQPIGDRFGLDNVVKGSQFAANRTIGVEGSLGGGRCRFHVSCLCWARSWSCFHRGPAATPPWPKIPNTSKSDLACYQ